MSSDIMSSLYESIVWEQLTGYESVSTISIFRKAKEEGIELLQITKDNLETQLEKLNTDDVTQVSPGGGRHGELPYVKISTVSSEVGKIKIVMGPEELYNSNGEKNVIVFFVGGD